MIEEPRFNMSRTPYYMAIGKPLESREMLANLAQWIHAGETSEAGFWRGALWGVRQAVEAMQGAGSRCVRGHARRSRTPIACELVVELAKTAARVLEAAHG